MKYTSPSPSPQGPPPTLPSPDEYVRQQRRAQHVASGPPAERADRLLGDLESLSVDLSTNSPAETFWGHSEQTEKARQHIRDHLPLITADLDDLEAGDPQAATLRGRLDKLLDAFPTARDQTAGRESGSPAGPSASNGGQAFRLPPLPEHLDPQPIPEDPVTPLMPPKLIPDGGLKDFATEIARGRQVPLEVCFLSALTALAAAANGRYRLACRSAPDAGLDYVWPTLYSAIAMPSAEGKSDVFSDVTAPLVAHEIRARAEREDREAKHAEQLTLVERDIRSLQGKISRLKDNDPKGEIAKFEVELQNKVLERAKLREDGDGPELLHVTDATPEGLAQFARNNGGCMSILSDEGNLVDHLAGMYKSGGPVNVDIFLRGWNGGAVRTARAGENSVICDRAILNILISAQPAKLLPMFRDPRWHELGLLGRCLVVLPAEFKRSRREPAPSQAVAKAWADRLARVLRRPKAVDDQPPHLVYLEGDAYDTWLDYAEQVSTHAQEQTERGSRQRILSTRRQDHVLHMLPLLALGTGEGEEIDRPTITPALVRQAIALVEFFHTCNLIATAPAEDHQPMRYARVIAKWLDQDRQPRRLKVRDICHRGPRCDGARLTAAQVRQAIPILVQFGQLNEAPMSIGEWEVNMPRNATGGMC